MLRKSVRQLSWLLSQMRPDIAFDALYPSTCFNRATVEEAIYSNKVIRKTKKEGISLLFQNLGTSIKNLHIKLFADASLGNLEKDQMTKSTMGYFIALCNYSSQPNPIH